ncbi:MAG: recombinase family protein [Patescibacteria group bacterium]
MNNNKECVIYLNSKGTKNSVAKQRRECINFCVREGLEPVEVFADTVNGDNYYEHEGTGFKRMVSFLKERPDIRTVLCTDIKRLAPDYLSYQALVNVFLPKNTKYIFTEHGETEGIIQLITEAKNYLEAVIHKYAETISKLKSKGE